ncbi:hypothetical protein GQ53DRAFT_864062 [Thozetella sp. PMI_491]|nr:hypothetical protein GQ53DRAFT_864062 [Thozetella sp. PMI_491]
MPTCSSGLLAALLAAARFASADPTRHIQSAVTVEPCAQVSTLWAAQVSASPLATPTVAARLAYECLNSVPLGKDAAIELVDTMVPYLEWQSDTTYKADPPADYPFPAYDIFGNLARIRAGLVADEYANEYEFQLDLYLNITGKGHDGHLLFYPDALTRVFGFERRQSLVSISEDGVSLPVIKLYEDVVANPDTASAVALINGVSAAEYVDDFGSLAVGNQDKDAIYNSMFFSLSYHATHGAGGFFAKGGRTRFIYPGPITTFTLANGTIITVQNKAVITANLTGVIDGPSYYAKFCNPNGMMAAGSASSNATVTKRVAARSTAPAISGYPSPVAITNDTVASCYYLQGEGYDNIVVIALLDMFADSFAEFQAVVQECIAEAVDAGKTKLIVDLQANGGGYLMLGYDFFRQLFPTIVEDGLSRWKESAGFLAAAQVDSDLVAALDPWTSRNSSLIKSWETWYNYQYDYNMTGQPFLSFEEKFRPHLYKNTNYTSLVRWNLHDSLTTSNSTFGVGIEITGYGSLSSVLQPFDAENIILLYDGACASTCSIFSEMLRSQGGVRSIAMGGRPVEGLIQGVGGIKGSQSLRWSDVHGYITRFMRYATRDEHVSEFARYSSLPLNRSIAASLNVRDAIPRDHIEDGLPAQYVNVPADCRLYWTAPMITNATAIWAAAADAAFKGASCVAGDLSARSNKKREAEQRQQHTGVVTQATGVFPKRNRGDALKRHPLQDEQWFNAMFMNKEIF